MKYKRTHLLLLYFYSYNIKFIKFICNEYIICQLHDLIHIHIALLLLGISLTNFSNATQGIVHSISRQFIMPRVKRDGQLTEACIHEIHCFLLSRFMLHFNFHFMFIIIFYNNYLTNL